jgi:hypothetical protein
MSDLFLPLGEIIAERELQLTRPDGVTATVRIRIGRPVFSDDIGLWECPFRITGAGQERKEQAPGVDSMQALLLTIQRIPSELKFVREWTQGSLDWQGHSSGGLPEFSLAGLEARSNETDSELEERNDREPPAA